MLGFLISDRIRLFSGGTVLLMGWMVSLRMVRMRTLRVFCWLFLVRLLFLALYFVVESVKFFE
jgi:hypothetical protein